MGTGASILVPLQPACPRDDSRSPVKMDASRLGRPPSLLSLPTSLPSTAMNLGLEEEVGHWLGLCRMWASLGPFGL